MWIHVGEYPVTMCIYFMSACWKKSQVATCTHVIAMKSLGRLHPKYLLIRLVGVHCPNVCVAWTLGTTQMLSHKPKPCSTDSTSSCVHPWSSRKELNFVTVEGPEVWLMRNLTLQSRVRQIASKVYFPNRLYSKCIFCSVRLARWWILMKFVPGWLRCLSFFLMLAAQIILCTKGPRMNENRMQTRSHW